MSAGRIVQSRATHEEIRTALRQCPLVALREMLTDADILETCQAYGHTFRRRRYGPVVTVLHFLAQALQRESSFAATWQQLWTPPTARFLPRVHGQSLLGHRRRPRRAAPQTGRLLPIPRP